MPSMYAVKALLAISGLSTFVIAQEALATITPCPSCPANNTVPLITVTSQYQPVSSCSPITTLSSATVSCSTYDFVSTVIPYLGGASSTLITDTDQIVQLSHSSTVFTSSLPCATTVAFQNVTSTATCTSLAFQTQVIDVYAPFNELGPLAISGYPGSGLCTACIVSEDETRQEVDVVKCIDDYCVSYEETWVSVAPTTVTSISTVSYTGEAVATQSGVNTIIITAIFNPAPGGAGGPGFAPVTSNFPITTSVPRPQGVQVYATVIVTFIAEPAPTAISSTSVAAITTATRVPGNGIYTIPIFTTFIPGGIFTLPVPTTVYYTTTVFGGPQFITVTTTVTVTFTETVTIDPVTVIGGTTVQPTGPLSTIVTTTTTATTTTTSTTLTSTPEPTSGSEVANQEFVGCLGSSNGFSAFVFEFESAVMDIDLCTTECVASGFIFSGLYSTECYCAGPYDETTANTDLASGVCNIPCPGDITQTCGGNIVAARRRRAEILKRIADKNTILLDVYSYAPTTTTSSSTGTSTETSATADPSSDPEAAPVARGINADMENTHKVREVKLRRGGMLRNVKSQPVPRLAKRDYALKNPFGQ